MSDEKKQDRGSLRIDEQECKGCGLCIEACPPKAIRISEQLNHYGYRTAQYAGVGCTGCGVCFMACPETGAITVLRIPPRRTIALEGPCASNLMKGNEAIVKSAILAGCRAFYGYPITPASEIAEAAALYIPKTGGVFVQAESEVAAINMLYGAAAAGVRAMTASSGPGISLMQEGISYLAGAELPCVIADITRAGPGLGNIGTEQGDYHQVVWGGGHGNYRTIVLAPNSVQEMADLTALAFELAVRYRNPVFVMADGSVGQMMEPVQFAEKAVEAELPNWAVAGTAATRANLITSLRMSADELEKHERALQEKYKFAEEREQRAEEWSVADADIVLVGYGIVSRILKAVAAEARADGLKVGLLRPITLWPFPTAQFQRLAQRARVFVVVEMSNGQMLDDVRLALNGARPVEFLNRMGGNVPSHDEVLTFVHEQADRYLPERRQGEEPRSNVQPVCL